MMKFKLLLLFLFVTFSALLGAAQEIKSAEWQRLKSTNGEFSLEMPKDLVYFYDKDGFNISPPQKHVDLPGNLQISSIQYASMQLFNASAGKTVMSLEVYRTGVPKIALRGLSDREYSGNKSIELKRSKIDSPGYEGRQIEITKIKRQNPDREFEISHITRYIATKTNLYVISVSNRGTQSAESLRFLSSLLVDTGKTKSTSINAIDMPTLKPLDIYDIGTNLGTNDLDPEKLPTARVEETEKPDPLLIISTSPPFYTPAAQAARVSGTAKLRVKFAETGRIAEIRFITTLPAGLNRGIFFSALRTKFIPPEKNGRLLATTTVLEYSFESY